jgi:hypothetical protein
VILNLRGKSRENNACRTALDRPREETEEDGKALFLLNVMNHYEYSLRVFLTEDGMSIALKPPNRT